MQTYLRSPIFLIFGFTGAVALLYATAPGIGTTVDSLTYIQAARNFAAGHGLSLDSDTGYYPLSQYPPLYCIFLTVPLFLGFDLLNSARVLHSLLMIANVALPGILILKRTNNTFWAALASMLMLTSIYILQIHAAVWSEALFLLLTQSGVLLLTDYFSTAKRVSFWGAAVATGLAFLTRYAGVALAGAAVLAILFYSRATATRRIWNAVIFSAISFLPTVLWFAHFRFGAPVANNEFSFHPIGFDELNSALYTISIFLLPEPVPGIVKQIGLTLFVIFFAFLLLRYWKFAKNRDSLSRLPEVLILFLVLYILMLCASVTFYWASIPMDPRTFSPVYAAGLLFVLCLIPAVLPARLHKTAGFFGILFLAGYLVRSLLWLNTTHADGFGYSSKSWRESKLIQKVATLPAETCLYTNDPYAIRLLLDRRALGIPAKNDIVNSRQNADYESSIEKMRRNMQIRGCNLVYFSALSWQLYMPTEAELKKELALQPAAVFPDGTLYFAKSSNQKINSN